MAYHERIVGYLRVSTEEQAREGVSLDEQRRRLEAWSTAHSVSLVAIDSDAGISGAVPADRRPGLAAALDRLESGEADGLVVVKLDRLGRDALDVLALAKRFKSQGWRLASVTDAIDTSTAAGQLILTVLAGLAEHERNLTSERTRFAMAHLEHEGRGRSISLPYGYRTADHPDSPQLVKGDRSPLVPHPEEQLVLARMFALQARGLGYMKIAKQLNAEDSLNPRSGGPWITSTVYRIMQTVRRREERNGE